MYCCTAIFLFLVALGTNAQAPEITEPSCPFILCGRGSKCSQNCGYWCGFDTPSPNRPMCTPMRNSPDFVVSSEVQALTCEIGECGYRSIVLKKCPAGFNALYSWVGSSCNRKSNGDCVWEFPECPKVRGPCSRGDCPQPVPPPPDNAEMECSRFPQYEARYECERNAIGECEWEFYHCPAGCPLGMPVNLNCDLFGDPCNTDPNYSEDECGEPRENTQCQKFKCGGCNPVHKLGNEDICRGLTVNCNTITCSAGYVCVESITPGLPKCVSTDPCERIRCQRGTICVIDDDDKNKATCERVPEPAMSCERNDLVCEDGNRCIEVGSGVLDCVPETGPCSDSCNADHKCPDADTQMCIRNPHNGKCEWSFLECSDDFKEPPKGPGGVNNCQVSDWSEWECNLACGAKGKETRTRLVTLKPNKDGIPCPHLVQEGAICEGTCEPKVPNKNPGSLDCSANRFSCSGTCPSPLTNAECVDDTWVFTGDVSTARNLNLKCPLKIIGNLIETQAKKTLRMGACAAITVTGDFAISQTNLVVDIAGHVIADGVRIPLILKENAKRNIQSKEFSTTALEGADPGSDFAFEVVSTDEGVFVDIGTVITEDNANNGDDDDDDNTTGDDDDDNTTGDDDDDNTTGDDDDDNTTGDNDDDNTTGDDDDDNTTGDDDDDNTTGDDDDNTTGDDDDDNTTDDDDDNTTDDDDDATTDDDDDTATGDDDDITSDDDDDNNTNDDDDDNTTDDDDDNNGDDDDDDDNDDDDDDNERSSSSHDHELSGGQIAGIVLGSVAIVLLLLVTIVLVVTGGSGGSAERA